MELRSKTAQMIENDEFGIPRSWEKIAKILVQAAKEVLGTHGKRVENHWIIGAEKEL